MLTDTKILQCQIDDCGSDAPVVFVRSTFDTLFITKLYIFLLFVLPKSNRTGVSLLDLRTTVGQFLIVGRRLFKLTFTNLHSLSITLIVFPYTIKQESMMIVVSSLFMMFENGEKAQT